MERTKHGFIGSTVGVDNRVFVGQSGGVSIVEKNPAGGIIVF